MLSRTVVFMVSLLVCLTACSGPNEKKMRFYAKGKRLMDQGDLVKASLELKNAIQIDPKYADAYYLLGQVELRKKSFLKAFECFRKAVEVAPGNLDAQVELGKLLLLLGDTGKVQAQEKADLVLKAQPDHAEGLMLQAAIYMVRRDWGMGGEILEKLIAGGVTKPDAYQMFAVARSALHDNTGAETILLAGADKNPTSLNIQKSLADHYAANNRVDDAAARIKRMIELEPENYGYVITLASLYWDAGRLADARDMLVKLQITNPKHEECLISLAGFYLLRRQTDDAEKVLNGGIKDVPNSFRLRFALSDLYNGTGRSGQAITLLKACLDMDKNRKNPEVIQARNMLARTCFTRGELPQAERYLAEILKVSPRNIDATYLKGRIHLQKKEGLAAISVFRTFVYDRPKEAEGYLLLADAHQINKEQNLALENLQQAERLEPDSLRVARAFARFSFMQKEYRQGELRMARYLSKHPDDLEARIELGDLYRLAGELRKAEAEYRAVKLHAPKSSLPNLRLSDLYVQQRDMERAVAEMEAVVRQQAPDNIQAALVLADLYTRAAKLQSARQLFEMLHARHPGEWRVANDYACFLADHSSSPADLVLAGSLAKNVADQRPDDPRILDTLGWIEYRSGNYANALKLLEKVDAVLPGHQIVSYHLGMASFHAGKKEQARSYLNKAVAGGDFPGKREAGATLKQL